MDDRKIIELFFERSEQAIIELSKKYGSVCSKVAFNILNNTQDTEECVNDAYLGTWNTIPPQNPNPLLSYQYSYLFISVHIHTILSLQIIAKIIPTTSDLSIKSVAHFPVVSNRCSVSPIQTVKGRVAFFRTRREKSPLLSP